MSALRQCAVRGHAEAKRADEPGAGMDEMECTLTLSTRYNPEDIPQESSNR